MDTAGISERTPLLLENGRLSPDPQHNSKPTTITCGRVTKTPPPRYLEDEVDGVLFSTNTHLNSREGTPEVPNGRLPRHLYGEEYIPDVDATQTKVYLTRFWILGCFSFIAMFQCLMWNTWGPLSASVDAAFPGWGSGTVAMMSNWGTIMFVVFAAPVCWLIRTKGLRVGIVISSAFIAAGTVVRVVPLLVSTNTTFFTVMCHVCAILVGAAGVIAMAAPPVIAAVWFPPKERTTATAVGLMWNQFGNAGSYLEPLFVREPSSPHPGPEEVLEIQYDIKRLLCVWAAVGVAMFLVIVLYFPDKPPTPPSITSHVERLDFKESCMKMFRNPDTWMITLSYSLLFGVPSTWLSVLNYSLSELGMSQDDAMGVGITSVLISGLAVVIMGRFTDVFYGYIKLSLIILIGLSAVFYYWFFLLTWGSIPVTTWQVYVTVVGGFCFIYSADSLFFELAVESAYPCSEMMVSGMMTTVLNIIGIVFLLLFFLPFSSYDWVTYVMITTTGASLIPLAFVKEGYSRSDIDRRSSHSAYQPI